jgi:hypothetical protein
VLIFLLLGGVKMNTSIKPIPASEVLESAIKHLQDKSNFPTYRYELKIEFNYLSFKGDMPDDKYTKLFLDTYWNKNIFNKGDLLEDVTIKSIDDYGMTMFIAQSFHELFKDDHLQSGLVNVTISPPFSILDKLYTYPEYWLDYTEIITD